MNKVFIALGTNIEPRKSYLDQALQMLKDQGSIRILKKSSIYETEPVGYIDQESFLNMVIAVETSLSAIALLDYCQLVERQLGRKRDIRFGPRTIDLDILIYNQECYDSERLTIPHPRMHERAFVLVPFNEIVPTELVPGLNKQVSHLLAHLPDEDKKGVIRWDSADLDIR